ncbi:2-succinyl-6-hydroxy-2,4-cyclohexadiene-1-carboxylate synthase [Weissella halotolerans]|uniref:Putative 2-succinyl-6-hydroxy-2,4-cyclohexadiene-1-carboxylate synthase n=1 Tax=Weissella halotolerans DSM 20190 TaxID=1123500 RepID=A0A0R2FWA6_9LACO|nr:2-succinyl-6-hydroxy-2,4-cyclohexadiene-1-carboxylate synthase [Weissella halotolerans]KRN32488.1 2-succinyl-6-hydroxy-2,4-cyclohexadiene-1-carboxylate synthase [Weissella halotolerans DSM 20190]
MWQNIEINGYHYQYYRAGTGEPTWLFLHGFLGSGRDFKAIQPRGRCIYLTLKGFAPGDPVLSANELTLANQVADLTAFIAALGLPKLRLVGYSMGARLALGFALAHPEYLAELILESGTPGLVTKEERLARQALDADRAQQILKDGLAQFVTNWEGLPLFASQQQRSLSDQQAMRQQRLAHVPANMAASLLGFGTGTMPNLWPQLARLSVPARLITGALDHKFTKLAQAMVKSLPQAEHVIVAEAGHNVHFEQPQLFTKLIERT